MPVLPQAEEAPVVQTLFLPGFVSSPSTTGGPLPYGLMSVAQMVSDGSSRWHTGIQFQGNPCGPAETTIGPCPESFLNFEKNVTSEGLGARGAETFYAYANIECSPVGGFWEDANARATAALINGEARAVEEVFWTGQIDVPGSVFIHPHLASDDVLSDSTGLVSLQTAATVLVTGVDIVEGLGILESALADCYNGVGVIHAEREALAHFAANKLLVKNGQRLETWGGVPIAFGAGYTGSGPDGSPPPSGTTWIYATGDVMIRRDPEITLTSDRTAAFDRSVNTLRVFAERAYNIAWDCCHFAVNVSLGGIITGTPGSAT